MNRRSFIGAILAAGVAPAIVRADSLMRIVPRETLVSRLFFSHPTVIEHRGEAFLSAPETGGNPVRIARMWLNGVLIDQGFSEDVLQRSPLEHIGNYTFELVPHDYAYEFEIVRDAR